MSHQDLDTGDTMITDSRFEGDPPGFHPGDMHTGSSFLGFRGYGEISLPDAVLNEAINVPPGGSITLYSTLAEYFHQSSVLRKSFAIAFRKPLPPCYLLYPVHLTDSLAEPTAWRDYLTRIQTDVEYGFNLTLDGLSAFHNYRHFPKLLDLQRRFESFEIATKLMFHKIVLDNVKKLLSENPENSLAIDHYAANFLDCLNNLKPVPIISDSSRPFLSSDSIAEAFGSSYVDINKLVGHYSRKLRAFSKVWVDRQQGEHNAPCTSLVNASMMGKSRFQKQLCLHDPVIYFCFRRDESGYPPASKPSVIEFFDNPFGLKQYLATTRQVAWIEDLFLNAYLLFFACLFEQVKLDMPQTGKQQRRMDLWNLLAEPARSNMSERSNKFWDAVFERLRSFHPKTRASSAAALAIVNAAYEPLLPLLCDSHDPSEHMLLLVFDEARVLTEEALDGKSPANSSSATSKFRMLRRSLRSMGTRCPQIFSIVTDTTSRLTNFQSRGDTDSSRETIKDAPPPKMFPPIIILPTVDGAAEDLQATCDPQEVQSLHRLMSFGRVAWSAMEKSNHPQQLLQLAISKLMRYNPERLAELFRNSSTSNRRRFLACLGPRLALQIGSSCEDARELVASHMMFLEYVGDDHVQLCTRYLSEPILAEASAQATAEYGWDAPLEALLYKILHGVVDAGFRGEFVTKALLCIAMEDAQRPTNKTITERDATVGESMIVTEMEVMAEDTESAQDSMDLDSPSIDEEESNESENLGSPLAQTDIDGAWHYSKVVSVSKFLNALFREPFEGPKRKLPSRSLRDPPSVDPAPADGGFVEKFLVPLLKPRDKNTAHLTPEMRKQNGRFLRGHVFFNHFIRADTTLRPSMLIKAWNRNAAIMFKDGVAGADFIIPTVMPGSAALEAAKKLGKCTSPWTTEQEKEASKIITGILIQTKNRQKSSPNLRTDALLRCFPLDKTVSQHNNFVDYTPQNPFMSILLELGAAVPQGEKCVQLHWVGATLRKARDYRRRVLKEANEQFEDAMKKTRKKAQDEAEKELEAAKAAERESTARYNLAKFQIPLVLFGWHWQSDGDLFGRGFKCLDSRETTRDRLKDLLKAAIEPVEWLKGPEKESLLRTRSLGWAVEQRAE